MDRYNLTMKKDPSVRDRLSAYGRKHYKQGATAVSDPGKVLSRLLREHRSMVKIGELVGCHPDSLRSLRKELGTKLPRHDGDAAARSLGYKDLQAYFLAHPGWYFKDMGRELGLPAQYVGNRYRRMMKEMETQA
jgi:hypothetical protein